jgi:glutaredoxin
MNFTVYSKRGCPYCTKVINVLNSLSVDKGYSVREYVLDTHFTREEFYKEFGEGSTFPQVVHEQKPIGGCADTVRYLQEKSLL